MAMGDKVRHRRAIYLILAALAGTPQWDARFRHIMLISGAIRWDV